MVSSLPKEIPVEDYATHPRRLTMDLSAAYSYRQTQK
jgi:hypothetical protein